MARVANYQIKTTEKETWAPLLILENMIRLHSITITSMYALGVKKGPLKFKQNIIDDSLFISGLTGLER